MAKEILTANQAREAYDRIQFCYLCGDIFSQENPKTRDHVPPKGFFKKEDRDFPLLLPAHKVCNKRYSDTDEQIANLVAILHGRRELPVRSELIGFQSNPDGTGSTIVANLSFGPMITKIVRGCHAALYDEFLPEKIPNKFLMPMPEYDPQTGGASENNSLPQHEVFCRTLKDSRRLAKVDKIMAFNSKFQFECCWARSDDGKTEFAVCAINIYDWHKLSDEVLGRPQGCIGSYILPRMTSPIGSAKALKDVDIFPYSQALNPFE